MKEVIQWLDRDKELPDTESKYLVVIDCDGEEKQSECTYFLNKKRFHFDMPHINWRVIKWIE